MNLAVAFGDLAFAVLMFACGLFDAPWWAAAGVALAMIAYWTWTRRNVLSRLKGAAWASQTAIALAVIIAILAGAYWLGLGVRGMF